tara:strand:+ start:1076 stop:1264 length:189 start_codon:yes stop_codon:yes gene_type:complete
MVSCVIIQGEEIVGTAEIYENIDGNYYGTFHVEGYTFDSPRNVAGFLQCDQTELEFKEVTPA